MNCDYTDPGGAPLERIAQQQAGTHPAPCARSCEANAYQIELRRYQAEVEQFRADARRFRLAEKNLFDVQEAAKTIAKQAIAAEAERDAMAAKLKDAEHDRDEFRRVMNGFAEKMAELEGQEPVGEVIHSDVLAGKDGTYRHELLCDFRLGVQTELYARPVPAESVNARLLWALKQAHMALIGYLPEHRNAITNAAIECACAAIAAAESAPEPVSELPVNARLLAIATNQIQHIYSQNCPDPVWGPNSRDPECPACQVIVSAEAQQERLLQDMHDAGREIDRVMAEATPKAARLTDEEIASLLAASDKNSPRVPSFFMTEPHKFARAIETAATERANERANASWALMCEKMVAAEREACAKVAIATGEALTERFGVSAECISTGEEIAADIRARGQK